MYTLPFLYFILFMGTIIFIFPFSDIKSHNQHKENNTHLLLEVQQQTDFDAHVWQVAEMFCSLEHLIECCSAL